MSISQVQLDDIVALLAIIGGVGKIFDWIISGYRQIKRTLVVDVVSKVIRLKPSILNDSHQKTTILVMQLRFTNKLGKAITINEVRLEGDNKGPNAYYENITLENGLSSPVRHWNFDLKGYVSSFNGIIRIKHSQGEAIQKITVTDSEIENARAI